MERSGSFNATCMCKGFCLSGAIKAIPLTKGSGTFNARCFQGSRKETPRLTAAHVNSEMQENKHLFIALGIKSQKRISLINY